MFQPITTFTPALGSTASPYFGTINITNKLCASVCREVGFVLSPQVTPVSIASIGMSEYVLTLNIQGVYSYNKCNCGCSGVMSQPLLTQVQVPIYSASDITSMPTITIGTVTNTISTVGCQSCGKTAVTEFPIIITLA
jgi:hypothetical protein